MDETLTINFGENKASVKQNTNGLWLCNELTIIGSSISDLLVLMKHAIKELDKILNEFNKKEVKKNDKSL